jgi:hypothetical protein
MLEEFFIKITLLTDVNTTAFQYDEKMSDTKIKIHPLQFTE